MKNNYAESYNAVVAKFVGGKRVCLTNRGSYEMRCNAAAVSYNSKGTYLRQIHKSLTNRSPGTHTKRFIANKVNTLKYNCKKKLQYKEQNHSAKKKTKTIEGPDKDYGLDMDVLPLPDQEEKKTAFLEKLQKSLEEINYIEKATIGQSNNMLWKAERSIRLTASRFGQICKLRMSTNRDNIAREIVFSNFTGNRYTDYGIEKERIAIEEFETQYNKRVHPCGFFIDQEDFYLGASPDGMVDNENAIIEVKCPYVAKTLTPDAAIATK